MRPALALIYLSSFALGADHYIRAGATGANNGSDWTNAWTAIAGRTWVRGDTYYIASGTYAGTVTISTSPSGATPITIKKATAGAHGAETGWNDAYATGQAIIDGTLNLSTSYLVIDGVTGSGMSGHGIKIYRSDQPTVSARVIVIDASFLGNASLDISHLEIQGPGYMDTCNDSGNYACYSRGVHLSGTSRWRLANCWIHDTSENGLSVDDANGSSYSDYGALIENSVISETGGTTSGAHGQGIMYYGTGSNYTIIRNSIFRNNKGSGAISFLGATGAWSNTLIYNNIFYITDLATYDVISPGVIWSRDGSGGGLSGVMTNALIANNTIYGYGSIAVPGVLAQIRMDAPGSTNVIVENNLFESGHFTAVNGGVGTTLSNNGYFGNTGIVPSAETGQVNGSATAFVDPASYDFRLKSNGYARGQGVDLSSAFTTDISGVIRPIGPWDIGAYQYTTPATFSGAGRVSGNATVR
jgi:hypothetical protein